MCGCATYADTFLRSWRGIGGIGGFSDDEDFIFAALLSPQHYLVGLFPKLVFILRIVREGRQSAADGQDTFSGGSERGRFCHTQLPTESLSHKKGLPRMFTKGFSSLGGVGGCGRHIPEDHGKFIPADAGDHVVRPTAAFHYLAHLTQNLIAYGMAVKVVILFEIVDIKQQDRNMKMVSTGMVENLSEELSDIAAIF